MVRKSFENISLPRALATQFRPKAESRIHGLWIGIHTRNVTWLSAFFQKLKWFRRVFTRYDKLDSSFLAFVHIAAITILLK